MLPCHGQSSLLRQRCRHWRRRGGGLDDNKVAIAAAGGISAIIATPVETPCVVSAAEAACGVLWNLTIDDENNQAAIVTAGGIPAVIEALTTHAACADVAEAACNALCNLADSADNRVAIVAAGGVQCLTTAKAAHPASVRVAWVAAAALEALGWLRSLACQQPRSSLCRCPRTDTRLTLCVATTQRQRLLATRGYASQAIAS